MLERVPEKFVDFTDKTSRKNNRIEHFFDSALNGNALLGKAKV